MNRNQVTTLDIGGGLPVDYGFDDAERASTFNFERYSERLREEVPDLWTGKFNVITEFGRSLMSRNGFTASRAQTVKGNIVLTHVGANLFTRTAY